MSRWTEQDLATVGAAEELSLSLGQRAPVIIWAVRVADVFYVRSVRGRSSAWFGHAGAGGHIQAGRVKRRVALEEVPDGSQVHAQIDEAYRAKYGHYSRTYVDSVTNAQARAATLRLVPVD